MEKDYAPINEEKLDELAKNDAFVYGTCFADVSHSVMVNRENGFSDGFKEGYRKAMEDCHSYKNHVDDEKLDELAYNNMPQYLRDCKEHGFGTGDYECEEDHSNERESFVDGFKTGWNILLEKAYNWLRSEDNMELTVSATKEQKLEIIALMFKKEMGGVYL